MIRYYDREGRPIDDLFEWSSKFQDPDYIRVVHDYLTNGLEVSTVWLGIDHGLQDRGAPIIFETLVFPPERRGTELDGRRYCTEVEARAGHAELVEKWRNTAPEVEP